MSKVAVSCGEARDETLHLLGFGISYPAGKCFLEVANVSGVDLDDANIVMGDIYSERSCKPFPKAKSHLESKTRMYETKTYGKKHYNFWIIEDFIPVYRGYSLCPTLVFPDFEKAEEYIRETLEDKLITSTIGEVDMKWDSWKPNWDTSELEWDTRGLRSDDDKDRKAVNWFVHDLAGVITEELKKTFP